MRPFTVIAALLLVVPWPTGCGRGEALAADEQTRAETGRGEIPVGLLTGYDAIIVVDSVAAEGVDIAPSTLGQLADAVHRGLSRHSLYLDIPPVITPGAAFRGTGAEIHTRVDSVEREERRRFGWIGRRVTAVRVEISVRFVDAASGEPLGDWADLGELIGPAKGRSAGAALRQAAEQVVAHVVRDQRRQ